jgi:prolipoprotein diacylglyceryltransferase
LPWGLQIDLQHRPEAYLDVETFHPTFLYESLWMFVVAGLLVLADRRWRLGHGQVFALYVLLYCAGRLPIELVRVDPANEILGLRVNIWVAVLVGAGALIYLVLSRRRHLEREEPDALLGRQTDVAAGLEEKESP